jgi:hypothetical protein
LFTEQAAKAHWKGLRDNFRKELKKTDKPRSGGSAPPLIPQWVNFMSLKLFRDDMQPGKTSGNIPFTLMCNAEQQQLH